MKSFKYILFIFVFLFIFSQLEAINVSLKTFKIPKTEKIKITGDLLSYDNKKQVFIAEGFVKINYGTLVLTCDKLLFYKKKNKIIAKGNVRLNTENGEIIAQIVKLDLKNHTGEIDKGEIFIKDRNFHIKGEKIVKTEDDEFKIEDCTLTSCNLVKPFWAFTAKEATILKTGTTKAKKVKFKVKDYTLFYIPAGTFPGKISRNSGFLIPKISISDKFGMRYRQGYYKVLNKSMDSTFYYDLMSKRGIKTGIETRYALTETGKGWVKGFYLYDTGIKNKDYNIRDDKRNRYLINIYHDQILENNIKIYSDLYFLSDVNYIYDFKEDFNKHDRSKFLSRNNINSSLYLNKLFYENFNVTSESEWRKTLLTRKNEDTTQKLIDFNFYSTPINILGSKFYQDIKFNYANYYRKNGDKFVRFLINPEFTKNFFNSRISLNPIISQYFYEINNNKNSKTRAYLKLNYDTETQFSRVFNFFMFNFVKLNHVIEPEIEYSFISYPGKIPVFDYPELDRKRNIITYHLKNKVVAKTDESKFLKLIDWDIYQSFQIEKYSYLFNDKRFSNIFSDFKLRYWKYITLENDFEYNPYENYLETFNFLLTLNVINKFNLSYDYRFQKKQLEQLTMSIEGDIVDTFSLYFKINYDYFIEQLNSVVYGFNYHPQCWSLDFNIVQEKNPDDISINFNISLKGLD